jgi:phage replication initiation protein
MKIDWIEFTLKGSQARLLGELKLYFGEWQELDGGGLGYDRSAKVWQTGRVYWSSVRPDMGVHVRLPPTAMQTVGVDHLSILKDFMPMGAKVTRLDIAADDTLGQLSLDTIREKVIAGEFVLRARLVNETRTLLGGVGDTIYFGSRESNTLVRIYDKAAEQSTKGKLFLGHWIRVEMELKRERAHAAAEFIHEHVDTWREEARGWMLAFLDFKEPGVDENKSRWETCAWWSSFLDYASKVRLFVERVVKTVEDVKYWVNKQVTPSLYVLAATIGHDELFEMVGEASVRLSPRHVEMIQSYGQMLGEMNQASK